MALVKDEDKFDEITKAEEAEREIFEKGYYQAVDAAHAIMTAT